MINNTGETTFDLIHRLAGRDYTEHPDSKNRYKMICPACNYQPRGGGFSSFSINSDKMRWHCFACGKGGGYVKMLECLTSENYIPAAPVISSKKPRKVKPKADRAKLQGATLQQLADAKPGLTLEHLRDTMGWADTRMFGVPAIKIPYANGTVRYRVGITTDSDRFRWAKGSRLSLYGLDQLEAIRGSSQRYVLLVEGETDTAAARLMGIPVLGVPGASSWKHDWMLSFQGLDVYIFQEPDRGGDTLVKMVGESIGRLHVIDAPPGIKDMCELLDQCGSPESAAEFFTTLKQSSRIYQHPANTDKPKPDPKLKPAGDHESKLPMLGHLPAYQEAYAKAHRTALRNNKPVNFTTLLWDCRKAWKEENPENRQFDTLGAQGVKLSIFSCYFDNPRLLASQSQMENLIASSLGMVDVSGNPIAAYTSIIDCGRDAAMNCQNHGERYKTNHKCRQGFCPNCGTKASSNAGRVKMPWLTGAEYYRHVVFQTVDLIPEKPEQWGTLFSKQADLWQKTLKRASSWQNLKGKIYCRSHATYYGIKDGQRVAVTTWKALFHEDEEGWIDKSIAKIARRMGAEIKSDQRCQKSEDVTLQIVADFMTHFIGIDRDMPNDVQSKLFYAHYSATTGMRRHVFQAYGLLRDLIIDLPGPEPKICDVPGCGLKLHEVLAPRLPDLPSERHRYKNGPTS